jgi:ubiquinone biosynthesis monooxygenase Coq7
MTASDEHFIDRCIGRFDSALRTVFGKPVGTGRGNPAVSEDETPLSATDQAESINLMRVNHAGEVCAQALYQGQALVARRKDIRDKMNTASNEENDHLAWCQQRIEELGGHTSYLNPVWYVGSFVIGAATGLLGDKWSLGFLAETETQVVKHLEGHLERLPADDTKSRAILEQMREDEAKHGTTAADAGGAELPEPVKQLMALASKIMTKTAYRI